MANRSEEKERLRAERLAAQQHDQSSARRRLIAGYFVAGLLAAAVLALADPAVAAALDDWRARQTAAVGEHPEDDD